MDQTGVSKSNGPFNVKTLFLRRLGMKFEIIYLFFRGVVVVVDQILQNWCWKLQIQIDVPCGSARRASCFILLCTYLEHTDKVWHFKLIGFNFIPERGILFMNPKWCKLVQVTWNTSTVAHHFHPNFYYQYNVTFNFNF